MFLKSITGETVAVALTSGHAISIPVEGREVPQAFIADALKTGQVAMVERKEPAKAAEPKSAAAKLTAEPTELDDAKIDAIKTAITTALDAGDESFLTTGGIPDARKLDTMLGVKVSAAERDRAWSEILAEALTHPTE